MANGDFQPGTWNSIPTNCTHSLTLSWIRCAEYGREITYQCIQKSVTWTEECIESAWQTTKSCSWWTLLFCVLYLIVATLVCVAFALVASVVCTLFLAVEQIVCLFWALIEIIFCVSNASGGTAFLLTDGTVMMQESKQEALGGLFGTNRWWKLAPDQNGSYRNGSWSQLADSNVARTYFASSVLADGRVVVCGGEYSNASGANKQDMNNTCEIYDPVADSWTMFASPVNPGAAAEVWDEIGDAPCAVLPDGSLLMGSPDSANVAKLDPSSLTWAAMGPRPRVGTSDEDSWVLMPDNTVAAPSCLDAPTTWVYDIAADHWNQGPFLSNSIVAGLETGPALLRYDGTAFFLGANEHTAVYSPGAMTPWTNGIDLPEQDGQKLGIMDGPAATLVNGNILFAAAPTNAQADYLPPCFYFEYDGTAFNRTNDPPNNDCATYLTRLLLLPNGEILFCRQDDTSFYVYDAETAEPQDSFRPVIQNCPANLTTESTVQVSGLQFNGLSQAVAYGDDSQTATNYPLLRIVNKNSNHVKYCRTFGHTTLDANGNTISSMGVATAGAVVTTNVAIPADIELGDSSLFVVANGIPSQPFDVTITGKDGKTAGG